MDWFRSIFAGAPKTPEVLAAEDKVKSAQAELEAAKKAAATPAPPTPEPASETATSVGGRRKTRRSKKTKKSKRSRTGRKSSHP